MGSKGIFKRRLFSTVTEHQQCGGRSERIRMKRRNEMQYAKYIVGKMESMTSSTIRLSILYLWMSYIKTQRESLEKTSTFESKLKMSILPPFRKHQRRTHQRRRTLKSSSVRCSRLLGCKSIFKRLVVQLCRWTPAMRRQRKENTNEKNNWNAICEIYYREDESMTSSTIRLFSLHL